MATRVSFLSSLIWVSFFLFSGCATIVAPTGGDKDISAPKIVRRSMGDSTLQFKGGAWIVDFDEFIKIQDLAKEMNITPLVKNNPTVTAHKRRLTINIPDSILEANTTYRIDLGNAIRDIREGNPYNGLSWTFSTGKYFDSLRLYGNCIDAKTGSTDTSLYVFLYPAETPDSMLLVNKPLYITKNTAKGFEWNNLPKRDFKIVALQDDNHNFRRDALSDRIAFISNIVNPLRDTGAIQLYSFSEGLTTETKSKLGNSGRFDSKKTSPLNYTINVDTSNIKQRSFNIYDTLKITFSRKPSQINATGIRLFTDSVLEAEAQLLPTHDSLVYYIQFNWQENILYQLQVKNNFIRDSGNVAITERSYKFRTKQSTDYGMIRIRYAPSDKHIIQLVLNDRIVATYSGNNNNIVFNHLLPGQYTIRRHIDENNNGQWDTGSWIEHRQPERVELLNNNVLIKGNWENSIDLQTTNR